MSTNRSLPFLLLAVAVIAVCLGVGNPFLAPPAGNPAGNPAADSAGSPASPAAVPATGGNTAASDPADAGTGAAVGRPAAELPDPDGVGPCPEAACADRVVRRGIAADGWPTWWLRDGCEVKRVLQRARTADGVVHEIPAVMVLRPTEPAPVPAAPAAPAAQPAPPDEASYSLTSR